jgi:hypothetical protein
MRPDDDHQRVLLLGYSGDQADGTTALGAIRPSLRASGEGGLNLVVLFGQGALGLFLPVGRIRIDRIVAEVDAVDDV